MDDAQISGNGIEDIGVWVRALGRKRAPLPPLHGIDVCGAGFVKRRQARNATGIQRCLPLLARDIHSFGRHRLIRRRTKALTFQAFNAGLVVLLNLSKALLDGLVRHMVEADARAGQIIK